MVGELAPAPRELDLFACVPVADFVAARRWYRSFLGAEESLRPNAIEAVWVIAEHAYLYIEQLPAVAGYAKLMVMTTDIVGEQQRLAGCGLHPADVDEYDGMRKICYRDPDGNQVSYGGVAPST